TNIRELRHKMSIVKLDKLLQPGSDDPLKKLVQRSRNMSDLAQILRAALPSDVAPHLLAANLRDDGELVLICSSSSWAARLRFESESLLKAARQANLNATACSVKVSKTCPHAWQEGKAIKRKRVSRKKSVRASDLR